MINWDDSEYVSTDYLDDEGSSCTWNVEYSERDGTSVKPERLTDSYRARDRFDAVDQHDAKHGSASTIVWSIVKQ